MATEPDILVVDDDPDVLDLIVAVLENAGYHPRVASNGREALAAVEERPPALVLLDMLMPVMDGWACARALRSRYGRSPKIVVVTAAEHARAWAEEVGADGVLPKPFDSKSLVSTVARHTH
jgi:two-component system OmpR family response regulator